MRPVAQAPVAYTAEPYNEDDRARLRDREPCSGASSRFAVGVFIALELAFPVAQFRPGMDDLRPAAAGAHLGGDLRLRRQSALLGTSFHVVQRTCRARLFGGEALAWFVFWGYQFFIVMAALGYRDGRHPEPRIRRARMVHRPLADASSGSPISLIFLGTLLKRAGAAHLRRQLVLSRLHPHHRRAAHRQQPGGAGLDLRRQELLGRRPACRTR